MSLNDDIETVKGALRRSTHGMWPDPGKHEAGYKAFQAFLRICDQLNTGAVDSGHSGHCGHRYGDKECEWCIDRIACSY
jgi:hypothetical protein